MLLTPDLLLTPADSARAVTQVYTVSMLATVPLVVAGAASLALRRAPAGMRSLVWRSAVLALLIEREAVFLSSFGVEVEPAL